MTKPGTGHGWLPYAAGPIQRVRFAASDPVVKIKKNIHFEFAQDLVREPLLYRINQTFDVVVNIRGASVSDEGGFMALELEGEDDEIDRVLNFLKEQGAKVGEGLGSYER